MSLSDSAIVHDAYRGEPVRVDVDWDDANAGQAAARSVRDQHVVTWFREGFDDTCRELGGETCWVAIKAMGEAGDGRIGLDCLLQSSDSAVI